MKHREQICPLCGREFRDKHEHDCRREREREREAWRSRVRRIEQGSDEHARIMDDWHTIDRPRRVIDPERAEHDLEVWLSRDASAAEGRTGTTGGQSPSAAHDSRQDGD